LKLAQEIEMTTIHRSRTAVSAFVAVLSFALSAPFAVNAEDEVIVSVEEEQVLTAAPADLSWDETSGYGSVEASRAVRVSRSMLPAPSAAPALSDASATTQTSNLFTVSGAGFTAGGRVYLAIYDQMGAQLYETRWITASLPVLAVMGPTGHEAASINGYGGTLRASFANLCGATAMMRGYDQVTTTWSNWLTVEPACAA
jgi:hypothetical protein